MNIEEQIYEVYDEGVIVGYSVQYKVTYQNGDGYLNILVKDKVNNETLTDEEREEYKKKEDKLKERISNKSKDNKKEEVTDPETGKKIKKVKHTGPRGGHYYINDKGEHIYPEEWNESIKNMKSVKTYIIESKMVSLVDYLKKMVG